MQAFTNDECAHPYSPAYDDNGTVYVSGALSVDDDGIAVAGRREALDAALRNLSKRLATVGLGLEHVVKTTYFATDVSLRDEANEQYAEVFASPRPARSFVGVNNLPYGAIVEIEAVARRS
ncbi:RidA family protein [Nocardioides terrisoli]|uniref:RidA family protein n=1 Tax=Nocardioides terrisoli TaxID=3388267 RepID=UPI00287BA130|nr:RidA family protein [Nocardioides marmorisolisilvae]